MRSLLTFVLLTACATSPAPLPRTPPGPARQPSEPVATAPAKGAPPKPAEVPPPPSECAAYGQPTDTCPPAGALAPALVAALEQTEPRERDRQLACVERGAQGLAGVIRALRAELAPLACADAVVTPFLERRGAPLDAQDENALLGLLVAGQMSRLVAKPPELSPPFDKPRFMQFLEQELKPWMVAQALAIGELSLRASRLRGYGKAVAAVEAGVCDLRFVQVVREVPLPAELAAEPEFKDVYFAALDEALEPRKARGRDAALVGLRLFYDLGALNDNHVARARLLLSQLYAGSRVDALDALLLPELPRLTATTVEERLAASLPTFYASRLLGVPKNPGEPRLLRAFIERGLPRELRTALDAAALGDQARALYAVAEARRGVLYFSGPAFKHAAELAAPLRGNPGAELTAAVSQALQSAPRDAAELMLGTGPRLGQGLGAAEPLELLAQRPGPFRGEAEFDAAFIRWLSPPQNDPAFWEDLAARFTRARKALGTPPGSESDRKQHAQARAGELAESARETAKVLRQQSKP
ncbi:MAG TPA: hypothetical protein VER33_21990 [Polyangiaceae bacterium]|nr:hypothetical protein [Polyangiaceae bacterium]